MSTQNSTKTWRPAKSLEEAIRMCNEHPITPGMTYEERLRAQLSRYGL